MSIIFDFSQINVKICYISYLNFLYYFLKFSLMNICCSGHRNVCTTNSISVQDYNNIVILICIKERKVSICLMSLRDVELENNSVKHLPDVLLINYTPIGLGKQYSILYVMEKN